MLECKNFGRVGDALRHCAVPVLVLLVGCSAQNRGILIMAHGGDPEWNRDVEAVVEPIRSKYPTEIAFGMAQTSSIRDAVAKLERKGVSEIAVVRMFVSGDSFVPATEYILGLRETSPTDPLASRGTENNVGSHVQTAALHTNEPSSTKSAHGADAEHKTGVADHHGGHCMEAPEPIESRAKIVMSHDGVGDSPLVDDILIDRVKMLSTDPSRESVLILAHGPADDRENERWLANMNRRVGQLGEIGPFRAVRCHTLREDWPDRRQEAEQNIRAFVVNANKDGGRCLVIPFRVAGFGPYREVLEGLDYVADGRGFCPHPNMTRWVEQMAEKCWR